MAAAVSAELGQAAIDGLKPEPEDLRCWGVTTIIGCLDKPALIYWSAEQTARAAVRDVDAWQAIENTSGTDEAVEWLKKSRFRTAGNELSAANLGSAFHGCAETYALTGSRPTPAEIGQQINSIDPKLNADGVTCEAEVVGQMLDQFERWCQTFQPAYQATEVAVYSPRYGYAGTCDGFLTVGGVRCIIDYKTSRKSWDARNKPTGPYPEAALQLAAYRYAEMAAVWRPRRMEQYRRRYYLLSPEEQAQAVPVPEVDGGLVIHVTPEHCDAYPVRCDAEVHRAFLFVVEAARWSFEMSKQVIGMPLVAGHEEVVA